jgi:hypothetical protein
MVDFDMVFIALLYGLGFEPNRGVVWMCCIIQANFLLCVICMLTIMVICGNVGMHDYC